MFGLGKKKRHPAILIAEALKSGNETAIHKALKNHPDIDRLTPHDGTWLHYAARHCSVNVLKILVAFHYDVNDCSSLTGARPICGAAATARNDNVRYLLEQGSDLDVSQAERNPLFAAIIAGRGHSENLVIERAIETAAILLEAGIDFRKNYIRDGQPYNAKIKANEWGATEILALIEEYERR